MFQTAFLLLEQNDNPTYATLKTKCQSLNHAIQIYLNDFFSNQPTLTITIKMRADVLSPPVCGLGDGEAAFEQVAVFVFGRGVRFGLVLLPKLQLGDGAAQAGIVA